MKCTYYGMLLFGKLQDFIIMSLVSVTTLYCILRSTCLLTFEDFPPYIFIWVYTSILEHKVLNAMTEILVCESRAACKCPISNLFSCITSKEVKMNDIRDHPFKTSACLRGGKVSPFADGIKVTVHKDQKSPS